VHAPRASLGGRTQHAMLGLLANLPGGERRRRPRDIGREEGTGTACCRGSSGGGLERDQGSSWRKRAAARIRVVQGLLERQGETRSLRPIAS
jgi:hypothetical protein